MSSGDPRPARTRQRLFDTLFRLAETHDLSSLTISEIARTAGVDRGSFYAQFADKTAFLDAAGMLLIAEFEEMNAAFESARIYEGEGLPLSEIPSLYKIVAKHPGLYRQLLDGAGTANFAPLLQRHMEAGFIRVAERYGTKNADFETPLPARARFATAGALGFVTRWLEHANEEEIDQYTWWAWEMLEILGLSRPIIRQPMQKGE